MNGVVNTDDVRHDAQKGEAPEFHFNRGDSREKLTVWGAVSGNGVLLGPYFFQRNVHGQAYLEMLRQFALYLTSRFISKTNMKMECFVICGGYKTVHQRVVSLM